MVQWTLQHPGVRVPDGSGPSYRIRTVKFPSQAATAMAVAMGESHQYGPAILGIAGTGDCRDQPATRDGIYGNEFFGRGNRVWGRHTMVVRDLESSFIDEVGGKNRGIPEVQTILMLR